MRLKNLTYAQYEGKPEQWRLRDFRPGQMNLLVGVNATGKSRTLSVISGLGKLLSGQLKLSFVSGHYTITFDNEGSSITYTLHYEDSKVLDESYAVDGHVRLERSRGGFGRIWAQQQDDYIRFQTPPNELAIVARQDSVQHPFFRPLHQWAKALYHYRFGTPLGQDKLAIFTKKPALEPDPRDADLVVAIVRKGLRRYGKKFREAVIDGMHTIHFPIDDFGVAQPGSIRIPDTALGAVQCIYVKESTLKGLTDQAAMSQGMFRSLAIVILVTYAFLSAQPSCLLIDDLGEGLDYARSCALIALLRKKVSSSSVQLIATTNDCFVMNAVPLEEWSLLRRKGGDSIVYNSTNSKERFDAFKFTGLNNFDFLATEFVGSRRKHRDKQG